MSAGRTCAYFTWTELIGVAWYGLFALLSGGSELVPPPQQLLTSRSAFIPFASFLIVSSLIGFGFRRWIRFSGIWRPLLLGSALPVLGGALYGCTWYWLRVVASRDVSSTLAGPDAPWLAYSAMGALLALVFFYVTMPLGILSVLTLRWIDRKLARAEGAERNLAG